MEVSSTPQYCHVVQIYSCHGPYRSFHYLHCVYGIYWNEKMVEYSSEIVSFVHGHMKIDLMEQDEEVANENPC